MPAHLDDAARVREGGPVVIIILVTAAAVIAAGLFLRWATWPCLMAYELGRHVERCVTATGYRRRP